MRLAAVIPDPMRLLCLISSLLLLTPQVWAQPAKAKKVALTCERLCGELFAAIRSNPDKLTMRLEEALVIKEDCAAELVTTAITAVNGEPTLVRKIQQTAVDMAPSREAVILAAVRGYREPVVAAAIPAAAVEVRRAELPDAHTKPLPGEEIRRAQLPEALLAQQAPQAIELMNIPRAKLLK
jgi:hypothetical protein